MRSVCVCSIVPELSEKERAEGRAGRQSACLLLARPLLRASCRETVSRWKKSFTDSQVSMKGQWTVQCSSCQVCSSFVGTHWTLDSVYAAFPATPVFNMCYCAGSGRSHPAGEGESSPAHSRPFRGLSTKIIHYDCAPALILSCVFTSACVSSLYPSSHTCS